MNEPVYILGAGRTDFKRNLKKEGKALRDVIKEGGRKALDDAKIDPAVGNFNGGQFTKQLHLGAFIPVLAVATRHFLAYKTKINRRFDRARQMRAAHSLLQIDRVVE